MGTDDMRGPALGSRGGPWPWARTVADTLTLTRLLGGVALAFMPWDQMARPLGRLLQYNVLLWSTDAVDGAVARKSKTPPSWIGRRDMAVDCVLAFGSSVALVRAGFLPAAPLAAWVAFCSALYWARPVPTVLLVFMLPLHGALLGTAAVHRPPELTLFLLWLAVVAVANRHRLKVVIEHFIEGLPDGPRKWVWSWLPTWLRATPEERTAGDGNGGESRKAKLGR